MRPRFTLRRLMSAVAILALILAVVVQTFRLRQAEARAQLLAAEREVERAQAIRARDLARRAVYQFYARVEADARTPAPAPRPGAGRE